MQTRKLTAPKIDLLLNCFDKGFGNELGILKIDFVPGLSLFIEKVKFLKVKCDDENRNFWITAERGTIEDFGDYEEFLESGEVESKSEFDQLWLSNYPNPVKWYYISFSWYSGEVFIYIDHKLIIHASEQGQSEQNLEQLQGITAWLNSEIAGIIEKLKKSPLAYQNFVQNNLPYQKRFGKIQRKFLWGIFPESKSMIVQNLSVDDIEYFSKLVGTMQNGYKADYIEKMNASQFYNYCSIAYLSVFQHQKKLKNLNPKEMYHAMADGRDCGLKDIDLDSYEAFEEWYNHKRQCGGHPWEILRGGNSTHISLYVEQFKEEGWILRLNGSSFVRVNETIHIALAFFRAGVPFILDQAHEIQNMACGTDFIGIVNDLTLPRYCHSLFPPEDKINDFMNLPFENREEVINKAEWYNIEKIELS